MAILVLLSVFVNENF